MPIRIFDSSCYESLQYVIGSEKDVIRHKILCTSSDNHIERQLLYPELHPFVINSYQGYPWIAQLFLFDESGKLMKHGFCDEHTLFNIDIIEGSRTIKSYDELINIHLNQHMRDV